MDFAQVFKLKNNLILIYRVINATKAQGKWIEFKGKLKQKFAILTVDDLLFAEGKKDEMMSKI